MDNSENAVQPDLIFISKNNPSQPQDTAPYHGIPDLLIEILSPGNNKLDLITKKDLYQKFGVKEYWIINTITKESLVYQLIKNEYVLSGKNTGTISSPLFNHSFSF